MTEPARTTLDSRIPFLLRIDPQFKLVLARELVTFAGIFSLNADGELQRAGCLGGERQAAADLEGLPFFTDAGAESAAGNLVGDIPAVVGHAVGAGMGV